MKQDLIVVKSTWEYQVPGSSHLKKEIVRCLPAKMDGNISIEMNYFFILSKTFDNTNKPITAPLPSMTSASSQLGCRPCTKD